MLELSQGIDGCGVWFITETLKIGKRLLEDRCSTGPLAKESQYWEVHVEMTHPKLFSKLKVWVFHRRKLERSEQQQWECFITSVFRTPPSHPVSPPLFMIVMSVVIPATLAQVILYQPRNTLAQLLCQNGVACLKMLDRVPSLPSTACFRPTDPDSYRTLRRTKLSCFPSEHSRTVGRE